MNRRPIITTGRLHNRFCDDKKARLESMMERHRVDLNRDLNIFDEVELEIGMGDGMALLKRSLVNKKRLFIGCDVYLNGLHAITKCLNNDSSIQNVRICNQDIRHFLPHLPFRTCDRILIPYPDPWFKRRHIKRRLIQPDFLKNIVRVLNLGGEFLIVTDIKDYALYALKMVAGQSDLLPTFNSIDDCFIPPNWWAKTKFEERAGECDRNSWYMLYRFKDVE